jgi:hypothetical protein
MLPKSSLLVSIHLGVGLGVAMLTASFPLAPLLLWQHIFHTYTEPAPGVDTVHDVLLYAARTHGKKRGFAARDIERTITEEKEVTKTVGGKQKTEKKEWNYFKLKPFEWWTYEEMLANVRHVGSGLRSLGVGGEGETFFNIYGSTSYVITLWTLCGRTDHAGETGC